MIVEASQKRKGVKQPLHSSTELYGEKPMTLQPEYSLGEKYKFSLRRIGISKPSMKVVVIDQFSMA